MSELGKTLPDADVVNKQPKVLLIGYGWVGEYMGKYFTEADYVGIDGVIKRVSDNQIVIDTKSMNYAARKNENIYDLGIISVPTPMNPETGQCDISIVRSVVEKYCGKVNIFLVKSTVEIGTCKMLENRFNTPVCMSPEYIGETLGHPLLEPRKDAFQIIGGRKRAREQVAEMFMKVLHADAPILLVSHEEAEIIKYCENYWIMRRVDLWNDVFDICQTFKVSFNNVKEGLVLDPRLNRTHSNIYKDKRGWGGKCLSKDLPALAYKMQKMNKPLLILQQMIEHNADRRKNYNDNNLLMPSNPIWKQSRKIKLTKGYETIVDGDDFEWLNQWSWYYAHGYAVRTIYDDKGKPYQLRMHRLIINTPDGLDTDHINGDKLDNQRHNLRPATRSQNVANTFVEKQNKSGYKGVSWKKTNKKWCAQIRVDNVVKHIGLFDNKKDAAKAYNKAAKKYFKEFAYLNEI